jgi:hypothetical protein
MIEGASPRHPSAPSALKAISPRILRVGVYPLRAFRSALLSPQRPHSPRRRLHDRLRQHRLNRHAPTPLVHPMLAVTPKFQSIVAPRHRDPHRSLRPREQQRLGPSSVRISQYQSHGPSTAIVDPDRPTGNLPFGYSGESRVTYLTPRPSRGVPSQFRSRTPWRPQTTSASCPCSTDRCRSPRTRGSSTA